MLANSCALQGLQGHVRSHCYTRQSPMPRPPQPRTPFARSIRSVVIVDFREETYASIAGLMKHYGLDISRAENASELAGKLVSKSPELVLLNGTQPDENAWLTSAKLRTIDANRPVWIYAPEPPSAIDEWLSLARTDDMIVYGGVLQRLLDQLRARLSSDRVPSGEALDSAGHRQEVA